VNEQRLRALLRQAPVPGAEEAERRGLRVATAAFAQRQPARRTSPPRLALVFAAATLLAALLLSPAGAAVRDWIDDALTVGARDAEPALTEVPGGGRLLVTSPQGPWVVQGDGSRRLLGDYAEATWSPRGLFVAAVSERTLSALEPDGTPRWSLSAPAPVADPRWSPSGIRIAYRAGRALRVVAGDGDDDRLLARDAAAVAPVWWPPGAHLLAFARSGRGLRIVNADSREIVGAGTGPTGTQLLAWAPDGSRLLQLARGALWLRETRVGKLADRVDLAPPRRLSVPARGRFDSAAFSPDGETVAALRTLPADRGQAVRSELVLFDLDGVSGRVLYRAPGRLSDLAWSPDGSRLLIAWPEADQWLFLPANGRGRPRAVGGIAAEFSPGIPPAEAVFPVVEGWCCSATAGDALRP
jgi:dipeptidyl aminopeptidase/acylaminoacyl peptidase